MILLTFLLAPSMSNEDIICAGADELCRVAGVKGVTGDRKHVEDTANRVLITTENKMDMFNEHVGRYTKKKKEFKEVY